MVGDFGGSGGTTFKAEVGLDGVSQGTMPSTGQTGTSAKSVWLGQSTASKTDVKQYDDIRVQVGASPFTLQGLPAGC